jgi:AcrR family transcriptional regulator
VSVPPRKVGALLEYVEGLPRAEFAHGLKGPMPKNLSWAEVAAFRARLCEAAKRRFAEHGVEGVSMRALAEDLGCSAMTPYRYFRDKQEILAAVRAAAFDRFADAMEKAANSPGDAVTKARAVGEAYIRLALRDEQAYRLMFDLSQPDQHRFPDLIRAGGRARRAMSSFVERMAEEGVLVGDAEELGQLFWAASHGLIVLHLAGKLSPKPGFRALHAAMMRLLMRGARAAHDVPHAPRRPKPTWVSP